MPRGNIDILVGYCCDSDSEDRVVNAILEELDSVGDRVRTCDHCDNRYDSDNEGNMVYEETGDCESWCDSCRQDDAFYWESDEEYHTSSEPEDEDDDDSLIPGYHNAEIEVDLSLRSRDNILGIELETYQTDLEGIASYMDQHCTPKGWKYERDGSLDDTYGVELVSVPYTLSQVRNRAECPWLDLLQWSRENGGKSWNCGKGYGMHISLNGEALSDCHRARIVRFINDNESLCTFLAGRDPSQWASFMKWKLSTSHQETNKYLAAANRDDRIEVRIFRGSLNETRFVRNCEFVDAVRVYCQNCGNTDRALSEPAFRAWMSKSENRVSYPLLAEFIGVSRKKPQPQTAEC